MEENTQELILERKTIEIPIEKYEEDLETESGKEKKKEILDLFQNYNNLCSEEEFEEIENKLHIACEEGDVELIKIYLSKRIENESKDLIFKIDKTNQTASLFKVNSDIKELIIPRAVRHEFTEYLITSICGTDNDNNKIIKFSEDSAVETIYSYAFLQSKIKIIYFPKSLKKLKDGWCGGANKLTKIIISPSNDQFIFKENKYLLGKTNSNNDEFDILLFASRDIEEISIPSNIKIISSYAFSESNIKEISIPSNVSKICKYSFYNCDNLSKIEIPTNSKLQTIENNSFSKSIIKEIYFPTSLKELKDGWCAEADKLTKIIISPSNDQFVFKEDKYLLGKTNSNNDEFDILLFASRDIEEISIPSNVKIISSYAFSKSNIKEISIPSNVSKIYKYSFYQCNNLTKIEIPTNSNLQTIGKSAFSNSNIEEIFIPSNVSKICKYSFYQCHNLSKIQIPTNSNLQTIGKSAFSNSKIKEIFIPSNISIICESAFDWCENLLKIEIPINSKLQTIESQTFVFSKIKEIYFPTSLKELKDGWCYGANELTKIIISPSNDQFVFKENKYLLGKTNSNNDEFDILLFASRDIEEISIPSNIKIISSYAFYSCQNLTKIEIPTNSNLHSIGKEAFSKSIIKEISIPSNVSKICKSAFSFCHYLSKIEIPTNSKLQTIESQAFEFSKIKEIYFPTSLKELKEGWCYGANELTKIIISPSNDQFIFKENKYLLGKTNRNNDEFDILLFASRDIKEISIPSNVKIISSYAFENYKNLTKIEIPTNANNFNINFKHK